MPVWADTGNPPGPLNYSRSTTLIAFIRAAKGPDRIGHRTRALFEPVIDPDTGEEETFNGWVDPNYKPAPGATPFPACWTDEFAGSRRAARRGAPAGSARAARRVRRAQRSGTVGTTRRARTSRSTIADAWQVPADTPFTIQFDNQDAGDPAQHRHQGRERRRAVFKGEIFPGVATQDYQVAGARGRDYTFVCTVHPNMTGTLTAS